MSADLYALVRVSYEQPGGYSELWDEHVVLASEDGGAIARLVGDECAVSVEHLVGDPVSLGGTVLINRVPYDCRAVMQLLKSRGQPARLLLMLEGLPFRIVEAAP